MSLIHLKAAMGGDGVLIILIWNIMQQTEYKEVAPHAQEAAGEVM